MALGDPRFIGLRPGQFVLQEGLTFSDNGPGELDTGSYILLTHPNTPRSQYPQRGARSTSNSGMIIQNVTSYAEESTLVQLHINYAGSLTGTNKPHRIIPNCDVQMFTLPEVDEALNVRWVVPVPQPTLLRQYVTYTQPTLASVGSAVSADWLPAVPAFSLTFTPDPDQPVTRNYHTGWTLMNRTWPEEMVGVWLVSEFYTYFNALA